MKLTTFFLLCLSLSFTGLQAQEMTAESDYAQIEQTLNYYLHGGTNNNFEMLSKAFHETATMKFVREGKYTEVNALEFFEEGMDPDREPSNRKTRIVSINIAGNAASARVEAEYPSFMFVDYMNLLKIDGEWKIVSKIFSVQQHDFEE